MHHSKKNSISNTWLALEKAYWKKTFHTTFKTYICTLRDLSISFCIVSQERKQTFFFQYVSSLVLIEVISTRVFLYSFPIVIIVLERGLSNTQVNPGQVIGHIYLKSCSPIDWIINSNSWDIDSFSSFFHVSLFISNVHILCIVHS